MAIEINQANNRQINATLVKESTSKQPITFWKLLLSYIYNSLTILSILILPSSISYFIPPISKSFIINIILNIVTNFAIGVLLIIAIFQDIEKNYQIDTSNYKTIIVYLTIISLISFAILLLIFNYTNFYTNFIMTLFYIGLFTWLMVSRFKKNKIILKNKTLTLKNGVIFAIIYFIIEVII